MTVRNALPARWQVDDGPIIDAINAAWTAAHPGAGALVVFATDDDGVVYTGGKGKIAEHGGDDQQDRNVPILVVLPGLRHGHLIGARVETTQIAPSTLRLLGLDPRALQAVRSEDDARDRAACL